MNGEVISAFVLLIRILLALILLWAGLAKLRRPDAFQLLVLEYQVLPNNLARPFGQVLPYAEILIGLSLLLGFRIRFGALCACALLVLFIIAIAMNLLRGRKLSCMCFGRNRGTIGWSQIYRNLSLLFIAVVIVPTPSNRSPWTVCFHRNRNPYLMLFHLPLH
jgi:uncharacterized membrane protein YphA (DoxX/SURF4 family)